MNAQPPLSDPQVEREVEVRMMADMLMRMQETCFDKCVQRYQDVDLTTGEQVCIDRCVVKYMEVYKQVGLRMNKNPQ